MTAALESDTAAAWISARRPWRAIRLALVAGWVVMLLVSFDQPDRSPCAAGSPTLCGPDELAVFVRVLSLLAPILLCWMPLAGCLSGAVAGVLVLWREPYLAGGGAWPGLGAASALATAWLLWSMWRQRSLIMRSGVGTALAPTPPITGPAEGYTSGRPRLASVGVLFAAGLVLLGWYGIQVMREQGQADLAWQEIGPAVTYDDSVGTPDQDAGNRREPDPLTLPRLASPASALPEPSEPSWIRQLAEPDDRTGWLLRSAGCLGLGTLLAWRRFSAGLAQRRLLTSPAPALHLYLTIVDGTHLWLCVAGEEARRRVASLTVEAFGRPGGRLAHQPCEYDLLYPLHERVDLDTAALGRARQGKVTDTDTRVDAEASKSEDRPPATMSMSATVLGSFRHGSQVAVSVDGFPPMLGRLRTGNGERVVAPSDR